MTDKQFPKYCSKCAKSFFPAFLSAHCKMCKELNKEAPQ